MNRRFVAWVWLIVLVAVRPTVAQQKMLTIDDLYDPKTKVNFSGSPPLDLTWLPDGLYYLQRKTDPKTTDRELLKVNALTGEATPFFDMAKMEAAFARLPGFSLDQAKRVAHQDSLLMNRNKTAALINEAHDLFFYQFGSDTAVRLTNGPEPEVGEEFSPDGKLVSFVRAYNLYLVDVATQRERALTTDGGPELFNGRLDWVYQEEVYGRGNFKGYWWSPDSTRMVYLKLDESPVKEFTVVDHIPYHLELEVTKYPLAGDPNPKVQLGIIGIAGGATKWVDLYQYQSNDFLIVRVGWTPDNRKVVYQVQDREQTWLDLNLADADTGKPEAVLRETSKAWVGVTGEPYWLKDGSFLWLSERTGFQHLYHYAADGKLIGQITSGPWDVRTLLGVDEERGVIYFSGSEHSPIAPQTYRIKLDGTGQARLPQTEGTHRSDFNPTFTSYIDYWSDVNTPTQVRLYDKDGALVRVIDENKVEALSEYKLGRPEFLQVKTRDGFVMEAMMIKPPDFDPTKKYPVLSYTYSGPQAPQARNSWGGVNFLWHQMLAQKGYIIWICDNRTASDKGVQSAWPLYRNFGELELRDLEDGLAWLKRQPYVDSTRIGLWGWSYGGFMTCYALTHSTSFKVGIAGAPVTDWRDYDTIYTERYMATPQHNPDGYKKSSPVNAAESLHGKLLIIHGTTDDNVHLQNTIQFIYALEKAGKRFELMLYPKSRHGVTDPVLVKHLRTVMANFILDNL